MTQQMSRRTFLTLTAGVLGATALAACEAAPQASGGGGAAQEAVELRLTFWGDLADMPTWNWGLEEFANQQPEIGIQWENTPWGEYWTKLQTEMAGGTSPDIVGMVSMFSQQYIRQGTLLGLNDFIDREAEEVDVDDFWPGIMLAYRWEGETYAFPYDLSTILLMYNKNLFDEAGVPYPTGPWSWDEFLDACMKLTKDADGDGKVDQWGWILPGLAGWTVDVPLTTNKARFISEDGLSCEIGTEEAIETIQWLADLRNVHGVVPTPGEIGDVPLFETGRSAMTWGNPEFVQVLTSRIGPPRDNENFLWDVALFPEKQQSGNSVQGGSFAIGHTTEHIEEAWTFVKFYTSAPILREMVGVPSRGIPGRASIADSLVTDENPEHQQFFLDVMDGNTTSTFIPAFQQATAVLSKHTDPVYLGETSAAEACPLVVEELDPILQETA
ncbi:sugar ABC transporter substrate-binding protein [Chloroflexi bacterium TSY]|nr:sugar ABC transporter substrate-binding protein [Chloroflexi bacterium TSY]